MGKQCPTKPSPPSDIGCASTATPASQGGPGFRATSTETATPEAVWSQEHARGIGCGRGVWGGGDEVHQSGPSRPSDAAVGWADQGAGSSPSRSNCVGNRLSEQPVTRPCDAGLRTDHCVSPSRARIEQRVAMDHGDTVVFGDRQQAALQGCGQLTRRGPHIDGALDGGSGGSTVPPGRFRFCGLHALLEVLRVAGPWGGPGFQKGEAPVGGGHNENHRDTSGLCGRKERTQVPGQVRFGEREQTRGVGTRGCRRLGRWLRPQGGHPARSGAVQRGVREPQPRTEHRALQIPVSQVASSASLCPMQTTSASAPCSRASAPARRAASERAPPMLRLRLSTGPGHWEARAAVAHDEKASSCR